MKLISSIIFAAFLYKTVTCLTRWERFEKEFGSPWNTNQQVPHLVTDAVKCYEGIVKSTVDDMHQHMRKKISNKLAQENLSKFVVLRNTITKGHFLNKVYDDFHEELYKNELTFSTCFKQAKQHHKISCETTYAASISEVFTRFQHLMEQKSPELFDKIKKIVDYKCGKLKEEVITRFLS